MVDPGRMAIPLFVLWFGLIGLTPIAAALHVRRGRLYGFGLPVAAALLLLLLERLWIGMGWPLEPGDLALPYLVGLGMLAPAVGEGLRLRWNATRVMLTAVGLVLALRFLCSVAAADAAAYLGLQPLQAALLYAEGTDPLLGVLVGLQGLIPPEQLAAAAEANVRLERFSGALLAQDAILVALITLVAARRILERESWQVSLERLDRWRSPDYMIFTAIGSAALALLAPAGLWADLGINLFLVTMAPYILQGLAILSFWFARLKIAGWMRALLLALLIIQPLTIAALAAAGVGDIWFDLRRLTGRSGGSEADSEDDSGDREDQDE